MSHKIPQDQKLAERQAKIEKHDHRVEHFFRHILHFIERVVASITLTGEKATKKLVVTHIGASLTFIILFAKRSAARLLPLFRKRQPKPLCNRFDRGAALCGHLLRKLTQLRRVFPINQTHRFLSLRTAHLREQIHRIASALRESEQYANRAVLQVAQ